MADKKRYIFPIICLALCLIGFLGLLITAILNDFGTFDPSSFYYINPITNRLYYFCAGFAVYGIITSIQNIANLRE